MSEANYKNFMQMNRALLDCYSANMETPMDYKMMSAAQQRDWCYVERVRLEEQLIKVQVKPQDFFAAAQS